MILMRCAARRLRTRGPPIASGTSVFDGRPTTAAKRLEAPLGLTEMLAVAHPTVADHHVRLSAKDRGDQRGDVGAPY